MKIIGAGGGGETWKLGVPTGTVNGINTVFTLPSSPTILVPLWFEVNGQSLAPTADYTLAGATVTLVTPPPTGANLYYKYPG